MRSNSIYAFVWRAEEIKKRITVEEIKKRIKGPCTLHQFAEVRVAAVLSKKNVEANTVCHQRAPRVGDCATILEFDSDSVSYELVCYDSRGSVIWSGRYRYEDLVVENTS